MTLEDVHSLHISAQLIASPGLPHFAAASTPRLVFPEPVPANKTLLHHHHLQHDATQRTKSAGELGLELSHDGLTSPTNPNDRSLPAGPQLRTSSQGRFGSSQVEHQSVHASLATAAPRATGKRSPDDDDEDEDGGGSDNLRRHFQPSAKKSRLVAPEHLRLTAPSPTAGDFAGSIFRPDITSPLIFSDSPSFIPSHAPSFVASEAATSIMSGVQESGEGVTTLRMPKAQVTSSSPARSSSTPRSWPWNEVVASARSPDGRAFHSPTVQQLHGIGIVEFFEQDHRPTFIIDLTNHANFQPGPLHVVFANASLRASHAVQELLQADTNDPDHKPDFPRFKAWVINFSSSTDSMDALASFMSYGGISWTCATVRRRFRVVSGNVNVASITPGPSSPVAQTSVTPGPKTRDPTPAHDFDTPKERRASEDDYFGNTNHALGVVEAQAEARSEPASRPGSPREAPFTSSNVMSLGTVQDDLRTTFDWTRIPLDTPNLPEHIRFARSVDWASTPLGPVEEWTADLRSMTNMIMGSPHPAAMYWGTEYIAIYNEAYTVAIAGKRHPKLMGMSYRDAWTEIWDDIEPHFINAWNYGQAILKHDDQLFVTRNGFLEETFFDWSVVPLVGSDGSVVGIYNPAFDNTRRKVNERRLQTLRELGEKTSEARNVKGFWAQVLKALEYNPFDVPLALIYSVSEDSDSEVSSMHSGSVSNPPQVILEGSLGIGRDHPTAVPSIDLRTSDAGFAPYMRESMAHSDSPVVLSKDEGTLPGHLIEGLKWRGFGDPCRTIVVFPVHPTTVGDSVVGFIVLGVNPRLQYNEDYQLFVKLVTRQLATSMASVVLFEEEIKRGQRAAQLAALDRQELSLQLRLRTQEAVESEYRFSRMAAFGPVGMFITDGLGKITYCNDMWWKISGHERKASTIDSWMQSIRDEDRLGVEAAWRKLVNDKVAVTHEFRFRGSRQVIDGNSVETWVLMSAYPEKNDGGDLKSIFGCLTDISQQKWAEDFQKQRREEAVEMKRQQENFIDITSHEMRNPLSAILQCADEIAASIGQYLSSDSAPAQSSTLHGLLDGCAEAASTITLCASHQKRIVDDILTLSKLDSQLLLVTPVDVQPVEVVRNVLRMFDSELNSGNIDIAFDVDPVYNELEVDWVKLDPSRMRQVLINLLTNAIKFTQGRLQRSIIVRLGASKHNSILPPSYFPSRQTADKDLTDKNGWGDGDKLNIHVSVTDTGPGLDDDEKKILFQRFSQTTPRTHVQYGGSGLGLFICRMLTELQGGQIGVESKKGVGSSFAFYIKARKVANPDPDPRGIVPTPRSSPAKIQPVPGPIDNVPRRIPAVISSRETRDAAVLAPRDLAQLPQTRCTKPDAAPAQQFDVLIVEDNLVNQKVLQRQLKIWGNNTHVANHGGEALEALSRSRFWSREMSPISITSAPPPAPTIEPSSSVAAETGRSTINISVILMDLEMPVMDGMTCARKIRELEAEGTIVRHIPIIAVTAYARPEQIESAKAAGIDDVISKPFRIPDLLPKIKELVNKYNTNTITFSTPYSVADVEEIE